MAHMKDTAWQNYASLRPRTYTCGHSGCGREVGSDRGYFSIIPRINKQRGLIYICPVCQGPTLFDFFDESLQIPGVPIGHDVEHLPAEIARLYDEVRRATSQEAFTVAVLGCRKLLMHITVEKGAGENLGFVEYVNYLEANHYAPPNSQPWVDKIRQKGNEANHEIKLMSGEDALEIINFIQMLLKFIYESPGKVSQ